MSLTAASNLSHKLQHTPLRPQPVIITDTNEVYVIADIMIDNTQLLRLSGLTSHYIKTRFLSSVLRLKYLH
jgi:hypothetical protein